MQYVVALQVFRSCLGLGARGRFLLLNIVAQAAHHAVQRGYPLLAEARAIDSMAFEEVYDPPVSAGFVVPVLGAKLPSGGRGLPVEPQAVGTLCDRAANGLRNRLEGVSSKVPRWLLRFLGGVVAKALRLGT